MNENRKLLEYLESFLTESRKELFKIVLSQRTNHFTVATQDVYQLHNTSAVIRSCDVFGVQNVHVVEEVNLKKIDREIAMGAQKWVDINRYTSTEDCIDTLRNEGYRIIATSPHKGIMLQDFDISRPAALFFGRETEGLSEEVLEEADEFLQIPMVGFTESLNISVSAAIILQDVTARLRRSEINWQLSEEEQIFKRLDWAKKNLKNSAEIISRFEASR
ncbi:tRNA (guanosine-2'-O-)-methyltransferase [Salinimicrobium sediminis]|uniref:tRNA (guanosine(18)-2'-O)-methyltransferase n=1 Tax=Salinimicrobium sediminis TaxID=1343891 RepID=A0A285X830_9FLAO|nr:RNA methyltransferase [Salinimicrobium sediminis]SOC81471.1 tRNA (guanosine-2'-O-)-methyltransferase [Salinimicrobium sediminis]